MFGYLMVSSWNKQGLYEYVNKYEWQIKEKYRLNGK